MRRFPLCLFALLILALCVGPASAGFRGGYGGFRSFSYGGYGVSPIVYTQPIVYQPIVYSAPVVYPQAVFAPTAAYVAPAAAYTAPAAAPVVAPVALPVLSAPTVSYVSTLPYAQQIRYLRTFYGNRAGAIHAKHFTGSGRRR